MPRNGTTLTWRVTELEKNYRTLDGKVDTILQNHLPHLHEEVKTLKTRIDVLTLVNIGAIILAVLINRYL